MNLKYAFAFLLTLLTLTIGDKIENFEPYFELEAGKECKNDLVCRSECCSLGICQQDKEPCAERRKRVLEEISAHLKQEEEQENELNIKELLEANVFK